MRRLLERLDFKSHLSTFFISMPTDIVPVLNPGSKEAWLAGCTCPVMDNGYGAGYYGQKGIFVISGDCPIHANQIPTQEATK